MSRDPDGIDLWPSFVRAPSAVCAAPILVVDDDPAQLHAVTTMLRAARFAVATASSSAEALVRAAVQRPELIVTEAVLLGTPCAAMLTALRDLAPHAAILVTTALAPSDPRIAPALRIARASYLPKPLDHERLLARLRRALLAGATGGR